MGTWPFMMIFLSSSLFLVLLNLEVIDAVGCTGNFISSNSSFRQNRQKLFSTLAEKVISNDGFYNASVGQSPDRVHALVLCARGYEREACMSCVERATQGIQSQCPNLMDSFTWDQDDEERVSCLVSSSNHSTFGNLELEPPIRYKSPLGMEYLTTNMTLFEKQWNATLTMTLKAAVEPDNSSVHKYYSAVKAGYTKILNFYMLMQCTPDITSQDCKTCLGECVNLFKKEFWGRQGGEVYRPSCLFRWDLYPFLGAFGNATKAPAPPRPPVQKKGSSVTDNNGRRMGDPGIIAIIVVFTFINLLVFLGFIKFHARRKQSYNIINGGAELSDSEGQFMLQFDLGIILMATNEFSSENKLGQGGFGIVYKGTFPNGQEIAVKRLTKGSGQGAMEFKNEVSLLTRLQHKNLVKLLGFCNEGDEEILVYEFVPNSSLDNFIFDEEKRTLLTWEVRFKIIEGIARGLLYLHEDSQLKIIHRDLKASNILLDAEMNPKVADFGIARLFHTEETRVETNQIAGTRGYMAPEYLNGHISAKSDVYGFGILLLEIISGDRNNSFEGEGLAAFAWKRWVEGKPEIIIDPSLTENSRNEIFKLIQIGLLCVQDNPTKRPTMSSVIMWLSSDTIILPLPNPPAFTASQSYSEAMTIDIFTELTSR